MGRVAVIASVFCSNKLTCYGYKVYLRAFPYSRRSKNYIWIELKFRQNS